MAGVKRIADVPKAALALAEKVSKADLLEAAWSLASLCHEGGCDDDAGTLTRLVEELDRGRARRGRGRLNVDGAA